MEEIMILRRALEFAAEDLAEWQGYYNARLSRKEIKVGIVRVAEKTAVWIDRAKEERIAEEQQNGI